MGGSQTMRVMRLWLLSVACGALAMAVRAQDAGEEMPECRDGDLKCYTQTGHRLFNDGEHAEAVKWFEAAGDTPSALDALGFAHETGQGRTKDAAKAFQLYSQAAAAG